MTPKEFDNMPRVKALYVKEEYLKASLMAKTIGNLSKDGKMRAHSQKLLQMYKTHLKK